MEEADLLSELEALEHHGDFTHTLVTEKLLHTFEKEIGHRLPEQYRRFLKEFGEGGILGAFVILGVNDIREPVFLKASREYRPFGLPKELIIIEECDDNWNYCLNVWTGKVVAWRIGTNILSNEYDSFYDYLEGRMKEALETAGALGVS